MSGVGMHEVVIETPEHDAHLCDLSVPHIAKVLHAYQSRARTMMADPRIQYVQIFKNWGSVAGASLEHSHAQIIALPIVPRHVVERINCAVSHKKTTGHCLICDIIHAELSLKTRVVRDSRDLVAITPYASRFPFEIHIYPKNHEPDFINSSDALLVSLAEMLKEVLFGLRIALIDPPFNYMIHTRPRIPANPKLAPNPQSPNLIDSHWHLEISPRLTQVAGFEWGTGFYINPTPPEQAAQFLRDVIIPAHLVGDGPVAQIREAADHDPKDPLDLPHRMPGV